LVSADIHGIAHVHREALGRDHITECEFRLLIDAHSNALPQLGGAEPGQNDGGDSESGKNSGVSTPIDSHQYRPSK
jgi:hypothetical protein